MRLRWRDLRPGDLIALSSDTERRLGYPITLLVVSVERELLHYLILESNRNVGRIEFSSRSRAYVDQTGFDVLRELAFDADDGKVERPC